MKTQTSPKTKWLKSLLLLPLLAGLLLSFSKTKEVERRTSTTVVKNTPILVVNQNPFSLKLNKKNTSLETLKEDFSIITKGKKSDLIIDSNGEISHKTVFIIREAIGENLGRINMAEGSFIKLNSDNFPSLKVKKGEFSNIPTPPAPNQDLPIPPPIPENATPQQRAKMQATIDAYEAKSKRKVYTVKNTLTGEVDSYIINDEEYTNEERRNALQAREEALRKREENISRNHPAPPPPPKSPLDYVIDMAKKEATFTYNGKTVSSDKAIQLLKENDELSISSHEDNGVARVDISKKPIKTTNYSKSSSSSITTVRTDEPENAYAYIKSLEKDNISYFYNGKSVSYKKMLKIAKSEPVISISTHIDNGVGTAHFSSVKN